MNNIKEFIQLAAILVNEISVKIISDQLDLYEAVKEYSHLYINLVII